jgi:hypothetical protein
VKAHRSVLHVTNGDSAGNTLRETTLGGAVVAWKDTLHEGPVPDLPRPALLQARARFFAECGLANDRAVLGELEHRDTKFLDSLRRNDQVVLWFEHDLYDQLQLVDALSLAHGVGAPELIVVDSYLGELPAQELEALWPARMPASDGALRTAAAVWAAFRAPEPTGLTYWASRSDAELPFLPAALRRLLEELPAPADGLSRTERSALEAIAAGARTPHAAFAASQQVEQARFLGDTWFFRTLEALQQRLVDGPELRLTPLGERVLRGEADRVDVLGIDRWLGGTHLTRDNVWRWDGARLSRD